MTWSAKQYVTFEDERTRPARDLLAAIPTPEARSVVDIGCGPGNSTELLVERFPGAKVQGLDSSADMIDAARKRLPQLQFEVADIDKWADEGPFDVIFANAVLQWVPDHATLLPALAGKLAQGGSLAIQMPDNLNEPSHRLMREVAANGPWVSKLADAAGSGPRWRVPVPIFRCCGRIARGLMCGAPRITISWRAGLPALSSGSRAAV